MKRGLWIGAAVAVTAVVLIAALVAVLTPVPTVLAYTLSGNGPISGPPWAQGWHDGGGGNGYGLMLPPELQGLTSIPPDQRFSHLLGVQVNLKDQNNQPLTVHLIPGKVTASSPTSLTIAANDGSTPSFTLNNQTIIHGMTGGTPAPTSTPPASTALPKDSNVVVVTLNGSTTATAILTGGPGGFAWPGPGGWSRPGGRGHQ